jgi:hypothetical protein
MVAQAQTCLQNSLSTKPAEDPGLCQQVLKSRSLAPFVIQLPDIVIPASSASQKLPLPISLFSRPIFWCNAGLQSWLQLLILMHPLPAVVPAGGSVQSI